MPHNSILSFDPSADTDAVRAARFGEFFELESFQINAVKVGVRMAGNIAVLPSGEMATAIGA